MATLTKNGERFATAGDPVNVLMTSTWDGVATICLFYFKQIKLEPIVSFEHLSGRALSYWLEGCQIENGEAIGPLRYIHGRSEVMKGKNTISAVTLALPTFNKEVPLSDWMLMVPDIYKRFLSALDNS